LHGGRVAQRYNWLIYYTYALFCADKKLYIGSTSDLKNRVDRQKRGWVVATKNRLPVKLVYYEACNKKVKAVDREKYFKTGYGRRFLKSRI
jgi:putative endonuclease